ncbi:FG-GAP-like repeat-containing protein [Occallatibacter riparius]|uniref:FG-GAP-like repeat-containing protein n=1 Tax=Occallatibacter riparius TaxID=1002689 RepID=A0A9J7BMY8_9BACT|nr:FG-GAP-like repeat-containing protein [Occallatibacter riparius]UWZ84059.1 FG-GAP-like repeat-containing protein [Occallatibacter riparius]
MHRTTGRLLSGLSGVLLSLYCAHWAGAQAAGTTVDLQVTAGGAEVTSVPVGTVVTLTATVESGSTRVTPGLVNFCDAEAPHCTDIHLLGSAQLTSAGTAVLRLRPRLGTDSIRALFAGTRTYLPSASPASSLTVWHGATSTTITQSGAVGNYTFSASVTGGSGSGPTGTVCFVDTANANGVLGRASLGAGTGDMIFSAPFGFTWPPGPGHGAVGDFNGDGILDWAIPSSNYSYIGVFLGKADGTFKAGTSYDVELWPGDAWSADFNGDGILDLAVGSGLSSVLLGKGDGTFKPEVAYPIAGAVGDFDHDGIPDIAGLFAESGELKLGVLPGKGDGTFKPAVVTNFGDEGINSPYFIAVGDLNNDGFPDLVFAGSQFSGNLKVLIGKGDGTFSAPVEYFPGRARHVGEPALADLNGDGILDIVVPDDSPQAGVTNAVVSVLIGRGDGTFNAEVAYPVSGDDGLGDTGLLEVGDFNGDGIPDIAMNNFPSLSLHSDTIVLMGNGDGTFGAQSKYLETLLGPAGSEGTLLGPIAADFNGDGLPDLLIKRPAPDGLRWMTYKITTTASISGVSIPAGHQVEAVYAGDAVHARSSSGNAVSQPWGAISVAMDPRTHSTTIAQADNVFVGGWAVDPQNCTPVGRVQILIDGMDVGNATLGQPRPDVAAAHNNPAHLNSGWTFTYPASGLSKGTHTVQAVAYDTLSFSKRLSVVSFMVDTTSVGPPWGAISVAMDARTHSTTIAQADNVFVGGWAVDPQDGAPVSRVQILIDGNDVGNATLNLYRPDVATAYNNAAYRNSGWSLTYPASGLPLGIHRVEAVGYDSLGLSRVFNTATFTVATTSVGPPWGAISMAVDARTHSTTIAQADNVFVGGWAVDPQDGAPVSRVQILIDGNDVGNATLNLYRPDVATAYNNPAYRNSGWSLTYSASGLSVGTHTVAAVGYDSLGLSRTLSTSTFTVAAP